MEGGSSSKNNNAPPPSSPVNFFDFDFDMPNNMQTPVQPQDVGTSSNAQNSTSNVQYSEENSEVIKTTGRAKAYCWQHFTCLVIENKKRAECKHCKKIFNIEQSGNGSLNKHLRNAHHLFPGSDSQPASQTQLGHEMNTFKYNQEQQRLYQAEMIIHKELPFNFADDDRYTRYVHRGLQPRYQRVSRITTRSDALKLFRKEKMDLINYFDAFDGRISLTSDGWTGRNSMPYLCITAHWIDNDWCMHKRIISFKVHEYPHDANSIYNCIIETIDEYKINNKIMSITFDNATNCVGSIRFLNRRLSTVCNGQFLHCRCACHIINLIVKDGLEVINPMIHSIRHMLMYVLSSPKRCQELKAMCSSRGIKYVKLEHDTDHRWNTTFFMLRKALRLKDVLIDYYMLKFPQGLPSEEDWEYATVLCRLLKVFYAATVKLSGVYYPTSSKLVIEIFNIVEVFSTYRYHEKLGLVIQEMENKFLKYWEDIPHVYTIALALDPTIRQVGVENVIEAINEQISSTSSSSSFSLSSYEQFNTILLSAYQHYETVYGTNTSSTQPASSSRKFSSKLASVLKKSRTNEPSTFSTYSELPMYRDNCIDGIVNRLDENDELFILNYWKESSLHFKILGRMARDFLSIQASTVASESCFSASGRCLDKRRSRLNPESLELCVCYKDWLDAKYRQQGKPDSDKEYSSDENVVLEQFEDGEDD